MNQECCFILIGLILFALLLVVKTEPTQPMRCVFKENFESIFPDLPWRQGISSFNHRFLKDSKNPLREVNAECLSFENAHCMMSNGTPGKCVLGGLCAPSFLDDPGRSIQKLPWCTRPAKAGNCGLWCKCRGTPTKECIQGCQSDFTLIPGI